jgi:sugar phosphate isomerase/epimerase
MLALYGDRLLCTHLNDNLGIKDYTGRITWLDDLHLLPFDGVGDWLGIARRLNRHQFDGPLTFELTTISKPDRHDNDLYASMDFRVYLAMAYQRACRVAALKVNG